MPKASMKNLIESIKCYLMDNDTSESIHADVMGDIDKLRGELGTISEKIESLKVQSAGVETNWLAGKSNALRGEFKVAIKEILNEELPRSLGNTNKQLTRSNDIMTVAMSHMKSPSMGTILIALAVGIIVGISTAIIAIALII